MSVRYLAGYSLVLLTRLLRRVLLVMLRVASLPERFALIVWTPREIDRYSSAEWNTWDAVREYSRLGGWRDGTEKALVEKYLTSEGAVLDLACGAGREALLLARCGLRVTACDWSPRMIDAAQRRAQEANLTIRFEVADLYDLHYPGNTFDYLLLPNLAYSHLFPRRRRVHFLTQAYSFLKPGGLFIISFVGSPDSTDGLEGFPQSLLARLGRYAPFNKEYEPGDQTVNTFIHLFPSEALKHEFEEARFIIKEWLWDQGYAVLAKA